MARTRNVSEKLFLSYSSFYLRSSLLTGLARIEEASTNTSCKVDQLEYLVNIIFFKYIKSIFSTRCVILEIFISLPTPPIFFT